MELKCEKNRIDSRTVPGRHCLCSILVLYVVDLYSMNEMNVDVILKALLSCGLVHKVIGCFYSLLISYY